MKKQCMTVMACVLTLFLFGCGGKEADSITHTFSVNKTDVTVEMGDTFQLIAVYGQEEMVYSSSDKNIVTVNKEGILTPVSEGVAYITIKADGSGVERTCEVHVENPKYEVVFINREDYPVVTNTRIKLSVFTTRDGVSYDDTITWQADSKDVSIVDKGQNAEFIATKAGEYSVKVTSGEGATAEIKIKVVDADSLS